MTEITQIISEEIRKVTLEFFSEECEIDINDINDDTNIIKDMEGDSLMFLELLEMFKKKYNLNLELKTIGKYIVKHPVETVGQIIEMTKLIIKYENKIADIE
ncbi:MAG: acyl carrier protein [Spirochaetes bacterium]|nr:acyl carrier protein [Spirochaetota bacterium]